MKRELCSFIKKDDFEILEYTPTIFHLFYDRIEYISFQRKIRFLFEYFRGYKVYYLLANHTIVGYCVVSKGGGRYAFASCNDIVVGPYYIIPKFRGKHYSEILLSELLNCDKYSKLTAYVWIRKNNIPSLKCSEKVGFCVNGEANIVGLLRKIKIVYDGSGEYYVFKYGK